MARKGEEEGVVDAEMSEKILPGACFQSFSATASECKVCFVAEDCERETKIKKKAASDEEEAPKKPKGKRPKGKKTAKEEEPKKDPVEVLVETVGESLEQSSHKESKKSLLFAFSNDEGDVVVKINILKASGKMKISIGDDDEVLSKLESEEEALELAERIVESAE